MIKALNVQMAALNGHVMIEALGLGYEATEQEKRSEPFRDLKLLVIFLTQCTFTEMPRL